MPRGFTDINLVGGNRDGEIIENVSLYNLPNTIAFDSETFFSESSNGGMSICKGKLNDSWHSYSRDLYSKSENEKYISGVTFEFTETIMVERCEALTKAGKRCMKPAINEEAYCSSVHQPK